MKNTFKHYYPLEEQSIKQLWDEALFVFDTNVLLNLYRYSNETSNKFLKTIIELKKRVWLPYQVGQEFHKNRLSVISDQKKNYEDFEKKINEIINEVENKNRNPFLSKELFKKLTSIKSDIKSEVDSKISNYEDMLSDDEILNNIHIAFNGKVGVDFKPEDIKTLFAEGEKRYKNKVPPGYCDTKKPENEKFGDLIIWKQILTQSKESKNDIIFVLDDRKEDWWLEHQGKTISARPELINEFNIETGRICHFYKPFQFLEYSNELLGKNIDEDIIAEVKNYKQNITTSKELFFTLSGDFNKFISFTEEISNSGYKFRYTANPKGHLFDITVTIPNIPDLSRRFLSKFISNLNLYDLELITINDNSNEIINEW